MDRTQEAINIIWNHAKSMKKQSYDVNWEVCQYRDEEGNKCFIGALISDQEYSEDIEGKSIHSIKGVLNNDIINHSNLDILTSLQSIHDDGLNWRQDEGLKAIAFRKMKKIILNAGYSVPE